MNFQDFPSYTIHDNENSPNSRITFRSTKRQQCRKLLT
uniref:Uncharacterized protein n=1 Tax=Brassica oleracea TaxID=3712 RepID=A0A3P6G7I4_BRAOL|nr:unnamed protein product [Brassica oleracea]